MATSAREQANELACGADGRGGVARASRQPGQVAFHPVPAACPCLAPAHPVPRGAPLMCPRCHWLPLAPLTLTDARGRPLGALAQLCLNTCTYLGNSSCRTCNFSFGPLWPERKGKTSSPTTPRQYPARVKDTLSQAGRDELVLRLSHRRGLRSAIRAFGAYRSSRPHRRIGAIGGAVLEDGHGSSRQKDARQVWRRVLT